MKVPFAAAFIGMALVASATGFAQTPATPPPATPRRAARPRPPAPPPVVIVRDQSGTPLAGVTIAIGGAGNPLTTGADGTAPIASLRDGSYRLRFEKEGFLTLERDVTIRARQPDRIEVSLSAAPPPPPPPPPPPAPAPPPPAPSSVASAPSGPPVIVSIPDFVEQNKIGRDPLKESVLGCLTDSTTRLLQLKEGIAEHTHADLDEVLYVVAGEGTVRAGGKSSPIAAGALSIIPHGVAHSVEHRGKNPLMVLSMLSGAPCRATQGTASSR